MERGTPRVIRINRIHAAALYQFMLVHHKWTLSFAEQHCGVARNSFKPLLQHSKITCTTDTKKRGTNWYSLEPCSEIEFRREFWLPAITARVYEEEPTKEPPPDNTSTMDYISAVADYLPRWYAKFGQEEVPYFEAASIKRLLEELIAWIEHYEASPLSADKSTRWALFQINKEELAKPLPPKPPTKPPATGFFELL